jgi:hypothetical protein
MSLILEQQIFLLNLAEFIVYCKDAGWVVTGGELYRTPEQQAIYVKTGRSQTMNSMHLKRCAIDLNFFRNGKLVYDVEALKDLGLKWESLDPKNKWGGSWKSFKDICHFQRTV